MNKEFNRGWARMNADGSGLLFFACQRAFDTITLLMRMPYVDIFTPLGP